MPLPADFGPEALASALERDGYALPHPNDREGYHGERHYDSRTTCATPGGRFFEVLEILPEHADYQDVVVLRRP